MQRPTSFSRAGGHYSKSSAACVCRRPLAVVVERKGESFRVTRVRVVEVAAELDGAIVVIVVVGVGAYQLSEIEARRRTIRFPEFVPVALGGSAVLDVFAALPVPVCLPQEAILPLVRVRVELSIISVLVEQRIRPLVVTLSVRDGALSFRTKEGR